MLTYICVGLPFRLLPWAKKKFDFAKFPSPENTRRDNRQIFNDADGIIICLDRTSVKTTRSIGTKLELRYALRQEKLVALYLEGMLLRDTPPGLLKDLPEDDTYLGGDT